MSYGISQPVERRPVSQAASGKIGMSVNMPCRVRIVNAASRKHDDARSKKDVINNVYRSENVLVNGR